MRVLFYIQHLWGVGHLARAVSLAEAMLRDGMTVTLVSGGMPVPDLETGPFELFRVPPIRARDASYRVLLDSTGAPVGDALWAERTDLLLQALEATRPDIILTESFPFARRKFARELLPLLKAAQSRTPRPLILASIRDIPEPVDDADKTAAMMERLETLYDAVLVHGDAALVRLDEILPTTSALSERIHYTGLVTRASLSTSSPDERKGIVVSAGGGQGGLALLRAALEAAAQMDARHPWRFFTGWNLGQEEVETLRRAAPENAVIERGNPGLQAAIAGAAVSVSRAGYNTVAESLSAGTPMVLCPHDEGGQREQVLRAGMLARRGLAQAILPADLSPETLARVVAASLTAPPAPRAALKLDGAGETARLLHQLSKKRGRNDTNGGSKS